MNFILIILAKLLYLAVGPFNFFYVILIKKKFTWKRLNGYFREQAIAIDRDLVTHNTDHCLTLGL